MPDSRSGEPRKVEGQRGAPSQSNNAGNSAFGSFENITPSINLPKGGGAIRGIGEKFAANPATGTGAASIPIITSPGRNGMGPTLAVQYDSGMGNGVFGIGWSLAAAAITRKTDRGIPKYRDAEDSDTFLLGGAEDLVPERNVDGSVWTEVRDGHRIHRYRPLIDNSFARIERWTRQNDGDVHWRVTSTSNVITVYGRTAASRIADAADARHVFSWLICESADDKGNGMLFEYAAEDSRNIDVTQVNERNRSDQTRSVNRYLKRIKYGNRQSLLVQTDIALAEWLFEVVFDYDEDHWRETVAVDAHGAGQVEASIDAGVAWQARPDAHSSHRSGFEVRTYRRCRRVLMFHRFSELGPQPCLVASTEFNYHDIDLAASPAVGVELSHFGSTRFVSQLQSAVHARYLRRDLAPVERNGVIYQAYDVQTLPPVDFEYTRASIREDVEEIDRDSVSNLPTGFDDAKYHWLDLEGEGLPGVLTEQAGAWYYKPNRSPLTEDSDADGDQAVATFAPLRQVAYLPQPGALTTARQWLDLEGDGALNLTELSGPTPGFFARTADENWRTHRAFQSLPNIDWQDAKLKLVDLTGDGLADVLITENDVFVWHQGAGAEGFGSAQRVHQALDEELGPRALFADSAESIFLADMSGDGLTDIVRIRHADVCYWPNLGYGRFGAKVLLDNAPLFESVDRFDPRRIRLADITGSGTVDIVYLQPEGAMLYFNQCGNRLSDAYRVTTPPIDDSAQVAIVDLLGNGTACLVWNSPLAANAHAPMRYVRLLQEKPYLLTFMRNNTGGETRVRYAPSTKFYLHDLRMGKPWITKLPFPVHVVERVESFDAISRNRFTSRYAYHHGYFDGPEREFRGFAMVEQWDTDAYEDYVVGVGAVEGNQELAPQFYQPPVLTKTWFHTGAYFAERAMLHQLKSEYFGAQSLLPDAIVPSDLDADEHRQCLRALKGAVLRSEIYSYDGLPEEELPYQVSESRYEVRCLQRRFDCEQAVCMRVDREAIAVYYERSLADPRIAHQFNLEIGPYGNVLKSASVVYGRQTVDDSLPAAVSAEQGRRYITYSESEYTADIDSSAPRAYRLRVPYEGRAYEITGVAPAAALFALEELQAAIATAVAIAYETLADNVTPQKRLLAHSRGLFLDNSLNPLPLGQWDTLALGGQSFSLALTETVVAAHYVGHVSNAELQAAGYVHFDGDADWWIPSDTAVFPADPAAHFYMPVGSQTPFGIETRATFDQYDLLVERVAVVQAPWNTTTAVNDYRMLGSVLATDANGNRAAVRMDVLGQVIATAVMGKEGDADGDTLDDPTTRMEYDLFNYQLNGQPNFVRALAREQHGAANPRWIESYAYTNGSGGVAMVKSQAHPGRALQVDSNGNAVEVDADPRWLGNGRTVVNNKGSVVKQYEPYFSVTHEYESERALRELGVTPIAFYDAVGRNVRTEFPNGTHTRVEFTPWLQRGFDVNDTVLDSTWYADRGSPDPAAESEPVNNAPRRAAWLSAKHANTPSVAHFDSLGRPAYVIADLGNGVTAASRVQKDFTGRYVTAFDTLGREASSGFAAMTGAVITATSAEKGQRWVFSDIAGAMVKTWDAQGRLHRSLFDTLRRPIGTAITEPGQPERVWQCVVYGDRHPNAQQLNLLGAPHLHFDQAGQIRVPALDFKGQPSRVERLLARDYQNTVDWSAIAAESDYANVQALADPLLETNEVFFASGTYDALGRPTQVTLPDNTMMQPTYDVGGALANLRAQIRGQGALVEFLTEQDYDAKGRRQYALLGNNVLARYFYDPATFKLTRLLTHAAGGSGADAIQDLNFEFDAAGNIVEARDNAQQTHYFNNTVVAPTFLFEYDAVNQLVRATGRELAGIDNNSVSTHVDASSLPQLPLANSNNAVRTYTQEYDYDLAGNITALRHRYRDQSGVGGGWTRFYRYAYQDDPTNRTNRLSRSSMPGDLDAGPYSGVYQHDAVGNMVAMPHLAQIDWNALDQLHRVDLGGGGTAHYVYDAGGQRIRKVINRNGSLQLDWIFLGGVMIFRRRRRDTGQLLFERRTVHINDNTGAIAQVDTKTVDINNDDPVNAIDTPLIRYQHGNHLGSCGIETDADGNVVSYEEYHPFGTTAYRANQASYDFSLKRFRYSGKEHDDESGLYYFGARYYAAWLGRWTSSDPAGFVSGFNLYRYCSNNPVMLHDPNGMQDMDRSFGLPTYSNVPEGATESDIASRAGRLRTHVAGLGYEWERDGATNPAPTYDRSSRSWTFGLFNPDHIPAGDPLGVLRASDPPAPSADDSSSSSSGGGSGDGASDSGGGGSSSAPSIPPRTAIDPSPVGPPSYPTAPVPRLDLPQAPPGTNFAARESAARSAFRSLHGLVGRSVAVQHWAKWRDGRRTNLDPGITNHPEFLTPISNVRGTGGVGPNGRTYATQHTLADRGLYPARAAAMRARFGNWVTERVSHVWAGRSVRREMTGSGGPTFLRQYIWAPMVRGMVGATALTATRTFVPFVVEAEMGLMGGGMLLYNAGYTSLGVTVFGAASYVPVIGGGLVAGAIVGNAAESVARELGASRDVAEGVGLLGAAGGGALIGAAIGSIIPGVGTAVGAGVGAAAGVIGYGLSKLF